jgi:nitroreductase
MNSDLQFIFTRRSIRKYKDKEVPDQMITDLLEAAMAAPSAVKKDPWNFIVIRQRQTLDKMVEFMPNAQMLKQATAALVVCGDITKAHDQQESYMLQDLSAAVENILLAANAMGLGTCWLGVHPRPDRMNNIRALFSLPDNIIPMCGIALGWAAEELKARTRFNADLVHYEKW